MSFNYYCRNAIFLLVHRTTASRASFLHDLPQRYALDFNLVIVSNGSELMQRCKYMDSFFAGSLSRNCYVVVEMQINLVGLKIYLKSSKR